MEETIKGKVINGRLNVRTAPSKLAMIDRVLEDGTTVEITEVLDGWYRIEGGYVMAEFVKILQPKKKGRPRKKAGTDE